MAKVTTHLLGSCLETDVDPNRVKLGGDIEYVYLPESTCLADLELPPSNPPLQDVTWNTQPTLRLNYKKWSDSEKLRLLEVSDGSWLNLMRKVEEQTYYESQEIVSEKGVMS